MHRGDVFGHADRPEVISDLKCNGTEPDISACTNITYTERPCSPGNEVGVTCGESIKLSLGLIVNALKTRVFIYMYIVRSYWLLLIYLQTQLQCASWEGLDHGRAGWKFKMAATGGASVTKTLISKQQKSSVK